MDRRIAILSKEAPGLPMGLPPETKQGIYNAMDENGKQMSIEFLKFTLEKMGGHSVDAAGNVEIKYNGEWLTAEQLFENFL